MCLNLSSQRQFASRPDADSLLALKSHEVVVIVCVVSVFVLAAIFGLIGARLRPSTTFELRANNLAYIPVYKLHAFQRIRYLATFRLHHHLGASSIAA